MPDKEEIDKVKIGMKDISRYISACLFSLGKGEDAKIIARGNNVKKAIDVLAILIRDYLDNPKYNIVVDSETYEETPGNKRNVSTIEISLSGVKKESKEK